MVCRCITLTYHIHDIYCIVPIDIERSNRLLDEYDVAWASCWNSFLGLTLDHYSFITFMPFEILSTCILTNLK